MCKLFYGVGHEVTVLFIICSVFFEVTGVSYVQLLLRDLCHRRSLYVSRSWIVEIHHRKCTGSQTESHGSVVKHFAMEEMTSNLNFLAEGASINGVLGMFVI
jgi:hypothetical protein